MADGQPAYTSRGSANDHGTDDIDIDHDTDHGANPRSEQEQGVDGETHGGKHRHGGVHVPWLM